MLPSLAHVRGCCQRTVEVARDAAPADELPSWFEALSSSADKLAAIKVCHALRGRAACCGPCEPRARERPRGSGAVQPAASADRAHASRGRPQANELGDWDAFNAWLSAEYDEADLADFTFEDEEDLDIYLDYRAKR